MGVERARLLADNIELDQRASRLSLDAADAVTTVDRLAAEETEGRALLAALDESLKSLRVEAHAAQEKRSEIELELVRKQAELKYLDETSRKELNAAAAEVMSGEPGELDEAGVAEAEQRYQEVRARIEALGPVNPQALEEYQGISSVTSS